MEVPDTKHIDFQDPIDQKHEEDDNEEKKDWDEEKKEWERSAEIDHSFQEMIAKVLHLYPYSSFVFLKFYMTRKKDPLVQTMIV
mmetsp:Transcript_41534/g.39946  ORF Transcript_41534/g.39946 Transcript_41534/m.39946 type:complete len:84 (+) Transcript_41534:216-467(+)